VRGVGGDQHRTRACDPPSFLKPLLLLLLLAAPEAMTIQLYQDLY
jgi:hypothetical protein